MASPSCNVAKSFCLKLCIRNSIILFPFSHSVHPACLHQVDPKRRGLLPLPFLPPLRVPEPDVVYKNVSDSESDTDCENGTAFSIGLSEVLPPSKDVKSIRPQSSSSSLSDSCLSTAAPLDVTNFSSGGKQRQSVSALSPSADIPPSGEFSDIGSPFAAHSDPFQFTVRLPHFADSSLVGAPLLKKSPPWKELRRDSQMVPPSTDHIYNKAVRHTCRIMTERSANIETAEDQQQLVSQVLMVAALNVSTGYGTYMWQSRTVRYSVSVRTLILKHQAIICMHVTSYRP